MDWVSVNLNLFGATVVSELARQVEDQADVAGVAAPCLTYLGTMADLWLKAGVDEVVR